MFQIGQRVVCVDDYFEAPQREIIPNRPVEGEGYHVRDCFQVTRNGTVSGLWAVHLNEIRNPMLDHPTGLGSFEPSFAAERFATEEVEVAQAMEAAQAVDELMKEIEEPAPVEM